MNIPHEWHDDAAGDALLPLVGTPYDAAGRIILALTELGLEVRGVAVEQEYGAPIRHFVHLIVAPYKLTIERWHAIDAVMCDSADVDGRWWMEDDAGATMMTRLAFEVG